jgi:glycosyltransferase involved in cell wall biosynthesis
LNTFPKLSVVTVVFNDLKALKKTVNSVLELEFQSLEYVIVDGGSTDGTKEYIQSLSIPFLKWSSEADQGIFDAFNKGIKSATGTWVHLLNAGDTYNGRDVFSKIDFSVKQDFLCFSVLKRKKKDFIWLAKARYNNAFVDVSHPGLVVKRNYYLSISMYSLEYKFISDSHFIWHHVSPGRSILYETILVDMADGGYSTNWRLQHEIEKQLLIFSAQITLLNKLKLHLKYFLAGVYNFLFKS